MEFILSAEYDDPSLLEGAVFKLTTKEGETVRDIYNEEIKTFTFKNGDPLRFELPDGYTI